MSVTPMIGSAPTKEATEREETGLQTRDRASTSMYAKSEIVIAMMATPLPEPGVSAVPTEMATETVIALMSGDMGEGTAKAGCRWGAPPPYPQNA